MTQQELENKYAQIPQEIKNLRRWIGYKIENRDGRETKVPINAINNTYAKSNDSDTWTNFRIAVMGCIKYELAGIGFMLGDGYFGIDLDNHEDSVTGKKPMTKDEFNELANEFVNALDSYSEYSHSGEGVHIICKGTLPIGARRRANCSVEMYDKGRFFTMTGNVINATSINERSEQIKPLWEKYLNVNPPLIVNQSKGVVFGENVVNINNVTYVESNKTFTDNELLDKIRSSRQGPEFIALYNGNMSSYGNDHSGADMALCKILAFWTGNNIYQIDRIFRGSLLMRDKWDQRRNATNRNGINLNAGTYGSQTIEYAIATQMEVYTPPKEKIIIKNPEPKTNSENSVETFEVVEFDERHDPKITIKNIFNTHYTLNDTGNAERFYDYFGENFKYNCDNNYFMFWDGRTWIHDVKGCVRKYANKLLDILYAEIKQTGKEYEEAVKNGDDERAKELKEIGKAQLENWKKVSNKGGKDAMLNELQTLHDIGATNGEFDTQDMLLNTMSGVVDLNTGKIIVPDRKLMLSKNTGCKVSFEEPKTWLKFLHDLFERKNPEETEEIISTVQLLLGDALTGRQNKDKLVILYGSGSNGKSTFIRVVNDIFGDYGFTMNSNMLIQDPNSSSQSNEFALASLLGKRFVSTSETAEGKKMDEVALKQMLSGEQITAQFKYGQQFRFFPIFSPWMSTNNKPIIRATDFGTWRRIFFIPFLNTFTGEKKDVNMPKKLLKEMPQILGWMIQGCVKLNNEYNNLVPQPKCLEEALSDYKKELDVIRAFISDRCLEAPGMEIEAAKLYQVYKEWAKQNGEFCYSESRFKIEMPKKGYELKRNVNRGWVYLGLCLADNHKGIFFGE